MNQGFNSHNAYRIADPARKPLVAPARPVLVDGIAYTYRERTDAKYTYADAEGIACMLGRERGIPVKREFNPPAQRLTTVELNRVVADLLGY